MNFERLAVWKRSARLSAAVFREMRACRDLGFKDQIGRAALSIPRNIAEGMSESSTRKPCVS